MNNIRVRVRNPEAIRARLRPQQGIKVGDTNKYLFDPDLVLDAVEDARDWAIKTDGLVDEEDYSAKAWAIGGEGTETNNAKYYAEQAAIYRTTFVYEQAQASDTWHIQHNLNKYPSVEIVDSSGNKFFPAVQWVDENNIIVTMNGATKGKAYLN